MTQKITAIFGIAVLAAILLGGLTFAQSAMADRPGNTDPPKVVICHVPPGNPDNPQTIAVDPEEAAEHLAEHEGDSEGECGDGIPLPDTNGPFKLTQCSCPELIIVTDTICWDTSPEQTELIRDYCGALAGVSPENCGFASSPDQRECPMVD